MREGDYVYLLAPPEKAQALDRFFVNMPPPAAPDPRLLGDFFVPGDATLGALADIYGLQVAADHTDVNARRLLYRAARPPGQDRRHRRSSARSRCWRTRSTAAASTTVGLRLAEPEEAADLVGRLKALLEANSELDLG